MPIFHALSSVFCRIPGLAQVFFWKIWNQQNGKGRSQREHNYVESLQIEAQMVFFIHANIAIDQILKAYMRSYHITLIIVKCQSRKSMNRLNSNKWNPTRPNTPKPQWRYGLSHLEEVTSDQYGYQRKVLHLQGLQKIENK